MADADRIAALEAQVAALSARLDAGVRPRRTASEPGEEPLDRRALLRRSGAALAGIAAVPLLLSEPAAAVTGDPVLAGATTTADPGDVTRLVAANNAAPVLEVLNSDPGTTADAAQPVVRLSSASADRSVSAAVGDRGDLAISDGFFLNFAHTGAATGDADVSWGNVYTSQFANFVEVLAQPRRILDTRTGVGAGGSTAKRPGGSELVVDLSGIVVDGLAVFGNLTVTEPDGSGFLATYPQNRPNPLTSSINFTRAQSVANFALVGLIDDSFRIYTSQRTHIIFDVVGVLVYDAGQVDTTMLAAASPSPATRAGRTAHRSQ